MSNPQQTYTAQHPGHPEYPAGVQPPGLPQTQQTTAQPAQNVQNATYIPPPPPQRVQQSFPPGEDPNTLGHYVRDPKKLIAYLVPFPQPQLMASVDPSSIPKRFLIYTPPPPPLQKPKEGEKEGKLHKVQRKWEEEVRAAKTSQAKTASWKGVKSKATKGINWAMNQTTNSNLDFLGRVSPTNVDHDTSGDEGPTTKKTVPVEEMVLTYPPSFGLDHDQMRTEFVNTMLRTKSKAQRDTIIATGLMPVAYGIDILATLIWPFGGLGEVDTLWAWSSFRGAKTSRSVTKRLSSASKSDNPHDEKDDNQLKLNFVDSQRVEILSSYLHAQCHKVDSTLFPGYQTAPTETQVLEAIGWSPSTVGTETRNWEDEAWEASEVKDDLKVTFQKAAKEWRKWCLLLEKDPSKAAKK